ncbi:glucose 1-dehydrogenase [Leuconostoc mesenteroides]|uniref:glucose 1-dehydrogenase n=1 Tax=Leuconostoc mesenteroides TaxID=1245 RepID=UPI0021A2F68F|nr:glucose 1-dehydrogenase [Leuconostoc mesenteroides]MCT3050135.1 glucose 1-dehydrogenase [Leuconostoc mesenteroides]
MDSLSNLFDLTGRVAIVTGGASGLGKYYSQALLDAGADVFIVSRSERGWTELTQFAENRNRKVRFMSIDITESGAAEKIVKNCVTTFGQLDILVNNAGIQIRNNVLDYKDEDWRKVIDINLNALYFLSHEAAKFMTKQKSGKIINIGSMQSFRAGKFIFPYAASKHAVVGLTKAYADALAPYGVQVNALAPGYIDTEMTKALQNDPERNTEILNHIPAGHWAKPSELMGTVIYLASDASNYVNGATIPVDGGYLLR